MEAQRPGGPFWGPGNDVALCGPPEPLARVPLPGVDDTSREDPCSQGHGLSFGGRGGTPVSEAGPFGEVTEPRLLLPRASWAGPGSAAAQAWAQAACAGPSASTKPALRAWVSRACHSARPSPPLPRHHHHPGPGWPGSPAWLQTEPEAEAAPAVPCGLCPPGGRTIPKARASLSGGRAATTLPCPLPSRPRAPPALDFQSCVVAGN